MTAADLIASTLSDLAKAEAAFADHHARAMFTDSACARFDLGLASGRAAMTMAKAALEHGLLDERQIANVGTAATQIGESARGLTDLMREAHIAWHQANVGPVQ
jgi:hypothetical protein